MPKEAKKKPQTLLERAKTDPVKTAHQLVAVTEDYMAPRVSAWQRYRRKYRRGLKYLRYDNGRTPLYTTNYIFSVVETIRANLTRNLPNITIRAKGKINDQIAADLLNKVLRGELGAAQFKKHTQSVVQHGLITGIGWYKVGLDPNANNGNGRLSFDTIASEDLLVDPLCIDYRDARWFIHRRRDVAIDRVYATYGVMPEAADDPEAEKNGEFNASYNNKNKTRPAAEVSPVVDVYEVWIRNWDTAPEMTVEEDPETGEEQVLAQEGTEKPSWYILTVAGNTKLRFVESPYKHDRAPFVPFFDVEDDGAESIYYRGVGEVEEIECLQDRADALDQRIYQNIALTANRQRYISKQSGLNSAAMDLTPGRTYDVNGDATKAVHYDNPPMLSRDVYEYRNNTETLIQVVSGVFDVTQGRRPTGIVAGKAIQNLQEAAAVRMSFKTMSLAETIKDVCELALQIILQFYDGQRIIHLTDADKDDSVVILDEYPDAIAELLTGDEEQDAQTKEQFKADNGIHLVLSDIDFEYDIEADPDSALPASRADRGQLAADLFRLGAIDRKALLETLDFPNMHEILKRLEGSVTGKNAGNPQAELSGAQGEGIRQLFAGMAQQMIQSGMNPQEVDQLLQQMYAQMSGGEQGQASQGQAPQQGGNFPPQIAQ